MKNKYSNNFSIKKRKLQSLNRNCSKKYANNNIKSNNSISM